MSPVAPFPRPARLPTLDVEQVAAAIDLDRSGGWDDRRAAVRIAVDSWLLELRDTRRALPADLLLPAWRIRHRIWREDEDIRALGAGRIIRALDDDPNVLVDSLRDDAIVLQAHGYGELAGQFCERALKVLERSEGEPRMLLAQRAVLLGRRVVAEPANGAPAHLLRRRRLLDQAMSSAAEAGVQALREHGPRMLRHAIDAQIEHHLARIRGARGRPPRLTLDENEVEQARCAVDELADPLLLVAWQTTDMRWALAAGSPGDFEQAACAFAERYERLPVALRNQAWRYRALISRARRRGRSWQMELPSEPLVDATPAARGEPTTIRF